MTDQRAGAAHIGVNLLVLTERPPGGTGHHAISLFEALVATARNGCAKTTLTGFAIKAAARHFSPQARARLTLLPATGGLGRIANELLRLPLAARRAGVDILINPAFFGAPWGTRRRALIIHDMYFCSVPRLVPWRRRMLLKAIVPLLARRSEAIFTVSHATRRELQHFYPSLGERARVLHSGNRQLRPLGEGTANSLLRRPIERSYLLMVGHLTANKLPETAIGALALLKREGRDLALVHVGEDAGRLAPLAAKAGVAADVVTLGPQSDNVLADCYAQCEALVIPSIREGFGLPLIEAQAHSAPVIASSCEALMEVGNDSALYFPVDSPERCADAIRTVLDQPEQRRTLVERGLTNAARFNWDRTARQLLDALAL